MKLMRMIDKALNAKRDHAIFEACPGLLERSATAFQIVLPEAIKNHNRYWSQFGQDILVSMFLRRDNQKTFFDVGARCGVLNSNTLFLERNFGWSGPLIEPHRGNVEKAKRVRKSSVFECACSDKPGTLEFVELPEEPGHSRLRKDFKGRAIPDGAETHSVRVTTVAEVCREEGYDHLDYLDIDVEGGELSVLNGIDFNSVEIQLIGVETHPPAFDDISSYLSKFGFLPRVRLGVDTFYAKDATWDRIVSDFPRLEIGV